jgi:hypothetical protein
MPVVNQEAPALPIGEEVRDSYPLAAFATRLEAAGAIGKAASRLWARNEHSTRSARQTSLAGCRQRI